ncbi:hypothetical protein FRC19_006545 [Serendipita sp. 401]|nr:hypothetical protein FRC16_008450 [Serendipita sp. 398]KAG8828447.1 hypothetical protein FRC19_006545 [Serendipita sp. 401]KAG8848734.1 hypothetical protein FRC20_002483 [Serendipita sp. 405]KAG9058077.1 hypothetical protein FS842_001658 [Serendipita sp. 407]
MAAPVTISTASAVGDDAGSIEVETPDQKKERAMRQIEFYLSDSNLPFDKFLWGIYDKTDAHWVPIKQMATFKRMREFEEFGHEWLVEALRRSTKLEVDAKGENVKRTDPLVERPRESVEERSVYAKNFPAEYSTLQQDIERFFSRFGAIAAVRMRRHEDKSFKESVFCEYADVEGAQRFLNPEDGPRKFKGTELLIMSKEDYIKMKCEEKGIKPDASRGSGASNGKRPFHFNAFKLMQKEGRSDSDPRGSLTDTPKTFTILGQDLTIVPDEDGGGWVLEDESTVKYVKRAMIGFEKKEGDLKLNAMKVAIKKLLDIPSYIINTPGETAGYLVLQRGLTDSEYSKLQKAGDFVDGGVFEWKELSEDEERPRQLEYIKNSVSRRGDDTGGSGASRSKGGRGRGRGRGAGRGGGRPGRETRNREKDTSKSTGTKSGAASAREQKSNDTKGSMDLDPTSGAKRKRDGEPDGPEAAERGGAPVSIKKVRVE